MSFPGLGWVLLPSKETLYCSNVGHFCQNLRRQISLLLRNATLRSDRDFLTLELSRTEHLRFVSLNSRDREDELTLLFVVHKQHL